MSVAYIFFFFFSIIIKPVLGTQRKKKKKKKLFQRAATPLSTLGWVRVMFSDLLMIVTV